MPDIDRYLETPPALIPMWLADRIAEIPRFRHEVTGGGAPQPFRG